MTDREIKAFTLEQMMAFRSFVKVQKSGRYNMFDPRARQATGLSKEAFCFVMDNYDAMEEQDKAEA
jgi:hypothetical protein